MPKKAYVLCEDDKREIFELWPEFTAAQIVKRTGLPKRQVFTALRGQFGDMVARRVHTGIFPKPRLDLYKLGIEARRRYTAQRQFEEEIYRLRLSLPLY